MSSLLVSVRSADEALSALKGGAAVIDVKDPDRGPLGLASPEVWDEVKQGRGDIRPRLRLLALVPENAVPIDLGTDPAEEVHCVLEQLLVPGILRREVPRAICRWCGQPGTDCVRPHEQRATQLLGPGLLKSCRRRS